MKSHFSYLRHIAVETRYLLSASTGLDYNLFASNDTLTRAFVRNIEIIGEASKNIPEEVRSKHPQVDWKRMAGTRDRLIHGYFGIDYQIVWDIVVNKIPILAAQIESILASEGEPSEKP